MAEDDQTLDPALAAGLFAAHADELRRFLWGVLRDATLVQDVLQSTFVKLVEKGSTARDESRKAWLFRVAYHQALAIRRRQAVGSRVLENVGREQDHYAARADEPLVRHETVEQVKAAIQRLPETQQQIVRMRIYEQKTFAQIAEELQIPLGTALGRMRAAVAKLRDRLEEF